MSFKFYLHFLEEKPEKQEMQNLILGTFFKARKNKLLFCPYISEFDIVIAKKV